uniref:Dystrotelin n=1 Tax=Pipistrellus kuhlii TaxID=59472 RepID=A0A7J7XU03_PIPKU|nr:dystrotelin [Pipistrellus kuhlii]
MDTDNQDALNSIENSIYRTAFKLRSVQTTCQLDLIDSSQIQHILLRPSFWEARESPLSMQHLFQALQELFQRAREGPGHVHPGAAELTLSLLMAMYDSTGTGFLKLTPAAAALIALSGDSPLTKYRALFQLYAENKRGSYDSGARMTRRTLRNLLTDLQQIPAVVGESRALCSVESATRSCFQGVLSPAIKEERFLSWLQSEPPILLWLPTCYRLSATEMATHPARCGICRNFPITGLRYRCLKCLNFDICQMCFLSGLHSKPHQTSHPVVEHCVQEMSAKEYTKLLLGTLRSNLLQECWQRKGAARRQRLLSLGEPEALADRSQARFLKKQLNRYKDKLQALYTSQEEKCSRFETKIHELTANQDSLWAKLQQLGRESQAKFQPLHPSSYQNMISKGDYEKGKKFLKKEDSSQNRDASVDGPEWEPLLNPTVMDKSQQSQAKVEHALPNSESPEAILQPRSTQSTRAQSQAQKTSEEIFSSPTSPQEELLQETPQIAPTEINSPALDPMERKETVNIQEEKDELEEEELQELLSKLMDAFTLEMPADPQSSINTDLYRGAEQVSRAFSALVDQITLPNWK